jgi:hypothetical protein
MENNPDRYLTNKNYNKCNIVFQQQFGITKSTSDKPFISTFGMISCIGLVGYSTKYKLAFIAQIDNLTMIHDKNMGNIYYNIKQAIGENPDGIEIEVQLFGGFQTYRQEFVDYIYSQIDRYNRFHKNLECSVKINITKNNIGTYNNSSNICIDTNNGKLYKFDAKKGKINKIEFEANIMNIHSNMFYSEPKLFIKKFY